MARRLSVSRTFDSSKHPWPWIKCGESTEFEPKIGFGEILGKNQAQRGKMD